MSLKESIFSQFEKTHVEVRLNCLNEPVFVKRLTPKQAEAWQFSRLNKQTGKVDYAKLPGARAELVALCVCDADGVLVFDSADEVGTRLPNDVVEDLHKACLEINHLGAKDAQEAEGNS